LQGNGKLIFQGCISYVACILITYLGFAMLRFGNIEQKYARKLDGAARSVSAAAAAAAAECVHCFGFGWWDERVCLVFARSHRCSSCVLGWQASDQYACMLPP
jgi:hypothetical protein